MELQTIGTPFMWASFTLFILALLLLDLGIFHRKVHTIEMKEAVLWTGFWIFLAVIFNLFVWYFFGSQKALEFLTGYLIEKALSVDNIFIFIVIFSYFSVPKNLQHRALFWGILGALLLRAIFIAIGAVLLQKFHWIIYPFGILLIWTGIKLFFDKPSEIHPEQMLVMRLCKRFMRITHEFHKAAFFIKKDGLLYATPLFLVVLTIELTDLIFAIDSIPAIFAVTEDPFIVYTSNIFAILGLRALYFAVASFIVKFHYLRIGLAMVLCFVGFKMLSSAFLAIPIIVSLGVVILFIGTSMVASIIFPPKKN